MGLTAFGFWGAHLAFCRRLFLQAVGLHRIRVNARYRKTQLRLDDAHRSRIWIQIAGAFLAGRQVAPGPNQRLYALFSTV